MLQLKPKNIVRTLLITGLVSYVAGRIIDLVTLLNLYGKAGQNSTEHADVNLSLQNFFVHLANFLIFAGIGLLVVALILYLVRKTSSKRLH